MTQNRKINEYLINYKLCDKRDLEWRVFNGMQFTFKELLMIQTTNQGHQMKVTSTIY